MADPRGDVGRRLVARRALDRLDVGCAARSRAVALLGGSRGGAVERSGAGPPALRVRAGRRQLLLSDGCRAPGAARRAASPEALEGLETAQTDRAASRAGASARAVAQRPEE